MKPEVCLLNKWCPVLKGLALAWCWLSGSRKGKSKNQLWFWDPGVYFLVHVLHSPDSRRGCTLSLLHLLLAWMIILASSGNPKKPGQLSVWDILRDLSCASPQPQPYHSCTTRWGQEGSKEVQRPRHLLRSVQGLSVVMEECLGAMILKLSNIFIRKGHRKRICYMSHNIQIECLPS